MSTQYCAVPAHPDATVTGADHRAKPTADALPYETYATYWRPGVRPMIVAALPLQRFATAGGSMHRAIRSGDDEPAGTAEISTKDAGAPAAGGTQSTATAG